MPSPNAFTLDDFLTQMNQVQNLGPMCHVMGLIPGMKDMLAQVNMNQRDVERDLLRMRAMYNSMTPAERAHPDAITAPRRHRIARGAGVTPADVAKFLCDFDQSRAVMQAVGRLGVAAQIKSLHTPTSPKLTLGLVTSNRHHRDPSDVRNNPPARHPLLLAFLLALSLTTAAATVFFLLGR